MRSERGEWSSSTIASEALRSSIGVFCAWVYTAKVKDQMTSASSTGSCPRLRSSLVPSQKMLASRRISALLRAGEHGGEDHESRDEQRQLGQGARKLGESQRFREGADRDRQEIRHREEPPHHRTETGEGRHRRHHAGELGGG